MQLNKHKYKWGTGDNKWLGSAHGTSNARTVTIDERSLYGFRDGLIPSGTPLKSVEGGKFAPVTAAEDELAGFLLTDQSIVPGEGDVIAPLLEHGRIRVDYLPESAFDVTSLITPNMLFIYAKEAE